jgi:hypothetical protein
MLAAVGREDVLMGKPVLVHVGLWVPSDRHCAVVAAALLPLALNMSLFFGPLVQVKNIKKSTPPVSHFVFH